MMDDPEQPEWFNKIMRDQSTQERASGSLQPDGSAKPEIYVFERAEGWYPLELKDDADARKNAELNPGTLKVTTRSGRPVWPNEKGQR
jgi:hypothetical protein